MGRNPGCLNLALHKHQPVRLMLVRVQTLAKQET